MKAVARELDDSFAFGYLDGKVSEKERERERERDRERERERERLTRRFG